MPGERNDEYGEHPSTITSVVLLAREVRGREFRFVQWLECLGISEWIMFSRLLDISVAMMKKQQREPQGVIIPSPTPTPVPSLSTMATRTTQKVVWVS